MKLLEDDTKLKLRERLRGTDPTYFEEVVRKLLVKMGYGRDRRMSRLHGSGDGGLDGVIDRDELGLSKIYIQAKRYAEDASIGRPKIQEFVGALATRGASVGVFFTTRTSSTKTEACRSGGLEVNQVGRKLRGGDALTLFVHVVEDVREQASEAGRCVNARFGDPAERRELAHDGHELLGCAVAPHEDHVVIDSVPHDQTP